MGDLIDGRFTRRANVIIHEKITLYGQKHSYIKNYQKENYDVVEEELQRTQVT